LSSLLIVQDHIVQRGGGERVLLAMARAFPGTPILTPFFRPEETYAAFADLDVRTSRLNDITLLREHHRALLPIYPFIVGRVRADADVTLCGNAGWAQGAPVTGRKIVYFNALASWLYRTEHYMDDKGRVADLGLRVVRPWLRRWDKRTGPAADRHLVNGPSMQRRVQEAYGVDAEVVPPPVSFATDGEEDPLLNVEPGFFLCVTRMVSYKNPTQVIEAFRELPGERLVLAGDGPELAKLRAMAPANVAVIGNADDSRLRWLYRNCRSLIAAGYEPFGLTPVEAAAFGKGTIGLATDGLLDTVEEGATGALFPVPEPAAIAAAVRRFTDDMVDPARLAAVTARHTQAAFATTLQRIVAEEGGPAAP
jgi:glycosyltransferase involved in cell wall biosynthesis